MGGACYFKTGKPGNDGRDYGCLETCGKGVGAELAARAQKLAAAARTKGEALQTLVETIDTAWIDNLGYDRVTSP